MCRDPNRLFLKSYMQQQKIFSRLLDNRNKQKRMGRLIPTSGEGDTYVNLTIYGPTFFKNLNAVT